MDAEVIFHELIEDFDAAVESVESGVPDDWGVGFREDFVEGGEGFCCELEFEVQVLHWLFFDVWLLKII